jgi:hypothetical protein
MDESWERTRMLAASNRLANPSCGGYERDGEIWRLVLDSTFTIENAQSGCPWLLEDFICTSTGVSTLPVIDPLGCANIKAKAIRVRDVGV